ncbi:hypothetical protein CUROG_00640 [Corynebacterium urogenitale]|uniref:Uncharacterized protein n=1 Tax=Corynebacterium urogenitale TaxID=2487892 RepID=A0A5J6Z5Q9_9CORY|nr:hypothetical protein [Corynebacterium urogenitale]QFQ01532.1 hypothetical protein CUROG_00640 [Corynebacterium urogenitale]
MNQLFHHEEAASGTGMTHASTTEKGLGTSKTLNNWDLFVRESLQNSWDARDTSRADDGVTFAIDYHTMSVDTSRLIRQHLLPVTGGQPRALRTALQSSKVPLLIVSDTGTHGLRGPANSAVEPTGPTDFRSFVLDIGRSSDKELKGGTYGFGKGAFYRASQASTILVYSRTTDEHGARVHRFIGVAIGDAYSKAGFQYTGKHLWGTRSTLTRPSIYGSNPTVETIAEPVAGEEADRIAAILHMDRHFTEDRQTGTSIAVVAPDMENPKVTMENIASSLTLWAWPHMVHTPEDEDELHFEVSYEGQALRIPDPKEDLLLSEFVRAYKDSLSLSATTSQGLRRRRTTEISTVWSGNPKAFLGRLGLRAIDPLKASKQSELTSDSASNISVNSIALMRKPRMIVEYLPGPNDSFGRTYVGVFAADKTLDSVFAKSEPPSHDSWNPKSMKSSDYDSEKWKRTNPVNVALTRLKSLIREWSDENDNDPNNQKQDTATRTIAEQLGGIFTGVTGVSTRVSSQAKASSNGTNRKPSRNPSLGAKLVNIHVNSGNVVSIFELNDSEHLADGLKIAIETFVVADGSKKQKQKKLPEPIASIIGYCFSQPNLPRSNSRDIAWNLCDDTASIEISPQPGRALYLAVKHPKLIATGLDLKVISEEKKG